MERTQELKSLKRGLRAVALINTMGSITIAELARQFQVPRTTAERVLMTLLSEGFVERDRTTKAFYLTAQVHSLSDGYAEENLLVKSARPILFETTREIGWPLCLALPLGEFMTVRLTTDSETTLNLNRRFIGTVGPMAMVSSGLAFLGFLDDRQRTIMIEMLQRSEDPLQAAAKDMDRMRYLLDNVRSTGYSFGLDLGRERSVAVPVMSGGRVRGAIFMAFMARALTNEQVISQFVPRLKDIARRIEAALDATTDRGAAGPAVHDA
ncbi:helix-turn-helix domain-containing protein [Novosphingobium sp. BL-52-GroH]|uniref:helix-turn-helix domain-containing protein n=1 Tax=Novosphingobium sp. BL-52-GroH TaxID=3349877 RepID=UPI00384E30F3